MPQERYTKEEVALRGQTIYESQLRDKLEASHRGKYLVIDVETGEYEMDEDVIVVMKRAATNHPTDALYGMKIGSPVMGRIGLRSLEVKV